MKSLIRRILDVRTLSIIFLFGFIASLLISGRVLQYLHPRMVPFLYIALGLLGVMAVFRILFKEGDPSPLTLKSVVFLLPFAFTLLYPPVAIEKELAETKSADPMLVPSAVSEEEDLQAAEPKESIKEPIEAVEDVPSEEPVEESFPGLDYPDNIVMTDENFKELVFDIFTFPDVFIGKKITMTGYAFALDVIPDDQFVLGRLLITCCVADAGIIGLICQYEDGEGSFSPDTWYELEGVMDTFLYDDDDLVPIINITSLKPLKEEGELYIY